MNINNNIAEKQRSGIIPSLVSGVLRFKMDENAGTDFTESIGNVSGVPAVAISGTPTGIWANEQWFTTDAAADNYAKSTDAEILAHMRLDNLSGGLLIAFDYYKADSPAATGFLFGCGRMGATNSIGGFSIKDQASDKVLVELYTQDGTTMGNLQADVSVATRHSLCLYFDIANSIAYFYVDGILGGSVILPTSGGLPTIATGYGFVIAGKPTGTTPTTLMNTGDRLKQLLILRSESDISADLADIAQGLYEYENELPWALENK